MCRDPKGGGGGGLQISSDGMIKGFFWGLQFSIPEFSWEGKFGKYSLGGLI